MSHRTSPTNLSLACEKSVFNKGQALCSQQPTCWHGWEARAGSLQASVARETGTATTCQVLTQALQPLHTAAGSSFSNVFSHAGMQDTYERLSRAAAGEAATQMANTTDRSPPPLGDKRCVQLTGDEEDSQEAEEPGVMKDHGRALSAQNLISSPASSPSDAAPQQGQTEVLQTTDKATNMWQAYVAPTGVHSLDLDMLRMPGPRKSGEAGSRKRARLGEDGHSAG